MLMYKRNQDQAALGQQRSGTGSLINQFNPNIQYIQQGLSLSSTSDTQEQSI